MRGKPLLSAALKLINRGGAEVMGGNGEASPIARLSKQLGDGTWKMRRFCSRS